MRRIDCTTLYLPILARALLIRPSPFAQCISCVDDVEGIIAGVVYDDFNPKSVLAHIWVMEGKVPSREWFAAIFDYPFNRLKVESVFGQVVGDNVKAQHFDTSLGFSEIARIPEFSGFGDLVFYRMRKEECKILNSPKWLKIVERVAA